MSILNIKVSKSQKLIIDISSSPTTYSHMNSSMEKRDATDDQHHLSGNVYHRRRPPYCLRRLCFCFFCPSTLLTKTPQKPHPETLGEGGSTAGKTLPELHLRSPPERAWSIVTAGVEPDVVILCSLVFKWRFWGSSSFCLPSGWLSSPEMTLWSSHTSPDEPCLLNDIVDLWRPVAGAAIVWVSFLAPIHLVDRW